MDIKEKTIQDCNQNGYIVIMAYSSQILHMPMVLKKVSKSLFASQETACMVQEFILHEARKHNTITLDSDLKAYA